jgi:hypothetical protein
MSKLNDFEKVCKELNSNARASEDMDYVKLYLTNSIHGNKESIDIYFQFI